MVRLPIALIAGLTPARQPKKEHRGDGTSEPSPGLRIARRWALYAFFDPQTPILTPEELPMLAVFVPPEAPSATSTPFCVVMDDAARRIAIIPCWEIFRFYYARSALVAGAVFEFPRWRDATPTELLSRFDGHRFRARRMRNRFGNGAYALARLEGIGRDASVSYARGGRAEIRALPPFAGPAWISCLGSVLRLGRFKGLLVRRILESVPRCDANSSLWWW
jgi:hypothetical protein